MTRSPIYVAIDTPDMARAKEIVARVHHHVGGIKLGLEFFSAHGQAGVREMAALDLPIFLDLKLHDIPNTVAKAVQALNGLQPAILTVHAAGGRAMMEDAKAAAPVGTRVVAVTVLTSLDGDDLASIGVEADTHAQVQRLTLLAREAGLDGVVCSGNEVKAAKKLWPHGFFVVPGIRPATGNGQGLADQKRVMTPRQALDQGASVLVIGRPITQAEDPDLAARDRGDALSGEAIDETGLLLRDGGGFVLKRDNGGWYRLELHRMPVDLVEKRVRLIGVLIGPDHVDADGVQPA